MVNMLPLKKPQIGTSLIEVLVTLVILMIGLLGIAGLQIQAHQAELESYQRVQALILLQDMVDRINANRNVASCYAVTTDTANGKPFLGTSLPVADYANPAALVCAAGTAAQQNLALADLAAWDQTLQGAMETTGGGMVGAMIGARGCIVQEDAANRIYRVSVAWQGKMKTIDPTTVSSFFDGVDVKDKMTCGKGNYSDERMRRIVSAALRIGKLD